MNVRVVGLGEIGLRVAQNAERAGCKVTGIENAAERVAQLRSAAAFEISPSLGRGNFDATLVCVPTWSPRGIDMKTVLSVAEQLAAVAGKGELIAIESTVILGATNELIAPVFRRRGRTPGADVFIVSSPERIDITLEWDPRDIPKLVGGVTQQCTDRGVEVYTALGITAVPVSGAPIAEAAKLFENAFRLVNISFVNEMADALDTCGVDYAEVMTAAATKPFGFMPFSPGAGAGGHCVPSAARALARAAASCDTALPTLAAAIRSNTLSAQRVLRQLRRRGLAAGEGRVLILGAAYKSYASSLVESPGIRLANYLVQERYDVTISCHAQPPKRSLRPSVKCLPPDGLDGDFDAICVTAWEADFESVLGRVTAGIVLDFTRSAGAAACRN